MKPLTQRQEKFCLKYIECGNASEAYRTAYSTERMKPETVQRAAHRVMSLYNVCTRIDGLRAQSAEIAVLTQSSVIADLLKIKNKAMTQNPDGAFENPELAVKILELLGRNVNAWKPETMLGIQINNGGDSRESFEDVLNRAITINGGSPDFEERKQQAIGELYQRYQRGETIEESPVIGGLPNPFTLSGFLITTSAPLPDSTTIESPDDHGFIVVPPKAESIEAWGEIVQKHLDQK